MNIYIPIGSFKEINFDVLSPLENYNVHLVYEKRINVPQTTLPRLREDFESLKKQKNRILKLGTECGDDYFIMMDSDILHVENGIDRLIKEAENFPDFSMLALWPHHNEKPRHDDDHVATACCIIKAADVRGYQLEYSGGCFCWALIKKLASEGKKAMYIKSDNIIKHLNKEV